MLLAEGGSDRKTFARGSFSALPEASGIQNKAILNCQEQGSDTYNKSGVLNVGAITQYATSVSVPSRLPQTRIQPRRLGRS